MTDNLSKMVVLVTGASKGMGRAFVEGLSKKGARVACIARASVELEELKALANPNILVIPCDVTSSANVTKAVEQCVSVFGRLDAVIHNAAIFHPFKLESASDKQIEQHFSTNVFGPIWLTRAAIPHLKKSKGQLVSISSESVRNPFPYLSVYASTKAALETFSTAMREELRADGIRVTVLRSGAVEGSTGGEFWDPVVANEFFESIQRSGHAAMAGVPAKQASMTQALLNVLNLPSDVNVDLLEIRGADAGMVTDHVESINNTN